MKVQRERKQKIVSAAIEEYNYNVSMTFGKHIAQEKKVGSRIAGDPDL